MAGRASSFLLKDFGFEVREEGLAFTVGTEDFDMEPGEASTYILAISFLLCSLPKS